MPIYIKITDIKGDVTPQGHNVGGATGGVWKTTNFLTTDAASVVEVSRLSLANGVGGIDGRDAAPTRKAAEMFESARRMGTSGKLYVATDAGVYNSVNNRGKLTVGVDNVSLSRFDQQGRLVVGTDQGVWRSGGANKMLHSNNLKQIGLASLNVPAVDILVTDAGGSDATVYRLHRVSVTGGPSGTFTLTFQGQTTY